MASSVLSTSLILISIYLQIIGLTAVTDSGCRRSIDVQQREFGVVYEYFHEGNDAACSYGFRGEEGHRVMLAVNHIGLLPKQSGEQCKPQLTITDVSPEGQEKVTVICDEMDVMENGGFVSSANVAKVTFRGPSGNGILLLQYWFVEDVTLIRKDNSPQVSTSKTVPPVINKPDPTPSISVKSSCSGRTNEFLRSGIEVQCDSNDLFRPLQCSEWGSDINLNSCICVDKLTGETNELKPPYCLEPPESFPTRCLQELAEMRFSVSIKETFEYSHDYLHPPICDPNTGNYLELQCRYIADENYCKCVDQFTGNITRLAPTLCEFPLPTEEPLSTYLPSTSRSSPTCYVFFCTLFCEAGAYAVDEDGCQICECATLIRDHLRNETCTETRSRTINETIEQWELADPSPPYSWVPECNSELYTSKQSNHLAGFFCVDERTLKPSGKEVPKCDTYKTCVTDRISGFSKALRKAGYKKTSKNVKNLLMTSSNANDIGQVWNLLNEEEQENIFSKSSIYVPSCNVYGDFNALQCNYGTGNCWCVDIFGAQIEGSRRSIRQQIPDCTQFVRRHPGPVYLEDMYDFGFDVNDQINIYSTFTNFSKSDDIHYFWTKDGVPVPYLLANNKYSIDNWNYDNTITIGLTIYGSTETDAGSYRCNLFKSSTDYFYSSPPAKVKVYISKVYDGDYAYNYYNDTSYSPQCFLMPCEKICVYGYKHEENCKLCKCNAIQDIQSSEILENMVIEIVSSFGEINGRCEAKRQWIKKKKVPTATLR